MQPKCIKIYLKAHSLRNYEIPPIFNFFGILLRVEEALKHVLFVQLFKTINFTKGFCYLERTFLYGFQHISIYQTMFFTMLHILPGYEEAHLQKYKEAHFKSIQKNR